MKKGGATAIQAWIDEQMTGKSCVVVLVGKETAGRRWVKYEIEKGWNSKKGLVGVHIHRLKNLAQSQDTKGANPFETFTMCEGKKRMKDIVKTYDPPYTDSKDVYAYIEANLAAWVEEAIQIRNDFKC